MIMAQVIVTLKIMPKDTDVDINELETQIKDLVNPEKISQEPIAFGLVALNVIKSIPDASGELEELENKIKSIEKVGEIQVTNVTRSL
jgi:elongation factor 1-beta